MSAGLTTVHLRVNDAATGHPVPVRVRFSDRDGRTYPPLGRLGRFATGPGLDVGGNVLVAGHAHAVVEGTCEVPLPGGNLSVEVSRGPEYLPLQGEVSYQEGKLALRLALERWVDLRGQGWYSGDTRCHAMTPQAALLEAAAEDLAVVNVLARLETVEDAAAARVSVVRDILAFSGQQAALARPGHLVAVNTHNVHPVLGSLGLLHCHRAVYPLTFGGPDEHDDWTLLDWCYQCHRKKGLVVWTAGGRQAPGAFIGEALADLILGQVDALEVTPDHPDWRIPLWYGLLNCGFRVPLVGGSAKDRNTRSLGAVRTYARLAPGEALSYSGWIDAVRAGRTFVTTGPIVTLQVKDQDPGAVVDAGPDGRVKIRVEARSALPFDRLQVVASGRVLAEAPGAGALCRAVLEVDQPARDGDWLAARCLGGRGDAVLAHSSPVYIRGAGGGPARDRSAAAGFEEQLEAMLGWVKAEARCPTDKHRAALAGVFTRAREKLRAPPG